MSKQAQKDAQSMITKPPVVTIMGHVDHGKTTLLDHLRHSRIAAKEAGGITQHIGAYQVDFQGQPITFIDTPGHAAFSKMRAHGASITDIVILVVAADDGVKPQTKEAVRLIKQGNLPVIVAINKMDLKTAVPEMVKAQLVEEGLNVEGYGGNVPFVEISAREGTGVDRLLETILLLAELEELKADLNAPLEAVVLESALKRNQGPMATVLVTNGTLKQGEEIRTVGLDRVVDGKVKRLMNDVGKIVPTAGPSQAVEVLGFNDVPPAGVVLTHPDTVEAIQAALTDRTVLQAAAAEKVAKSKTTSDEMSDEEKPEIRIILLADTQGSLEAIAQNLSDEVTIIHASTGEVSESDVLMAQNTKSLIIAFNVKVNTSAKRLAEIEKVKIVSYKIIYELLEEFEQKVLKLLEPTIDEEEVGIAKVKAIFDIRGEKIAGCVVTKGAMSVSDKVHLKRNDQIVADARIVSLKQGKVDVKKVEENNECGLVLKPELDLKENDYIQAFKKLDS